MGKDLPLSWELSDMKQYVLTEQQWSTLYRFIPHKLYAFKNSTKKEFFYL